jgi:hypothetical protein
MPFAGGNGSAREGAAEMTNPCETGIEERSSPDGRRIIHNDVPDYEKEGHV